MKAKRGMLALVTEFTRDYSGGGVAGVPAPDHYFGIVRKITRDGIVKEIETIGRSNTYAFPARYGKHKLVVLVEPDKIDFDAAVAAIEKIQNPGEPSTWRQWKSETEAVDYLRQFKRGDMR